MIILPPVLIPQSLIFVISELAFLGPTTTARSCWNHFSILPRCRQVLKGLLARLMLSSSDQMIIGSLAVCTRALLTVL